MLKSSPKIPRAFALSMLRLHLPIIFRQPNARPEGQWLNLITHNPPLFGHINFVMSDSRHAVTRLLSLTGCGNFPSLTPAHQVLADTGIRRNTSVSRKRRSGLSR